MALWPAANDELLDIAGNDDKRLEVASKATDIRLAVFSVRCEHWFFACFTQRAKRDASMLSQMFRWVKQ